MTGFVRQTEKIVHMTCSLALPAITTIVPITGLELAIAAFVLTLAIMVSTWLLYAEAMRLRRLHKSGGAGLYHYPWAVIVLGVGLPFDALANVVVGAYWCELPRWSNGEWLLTTRLDRWARSSEKPTRAAWAQKVCRLLNRHDANHCFAGDQ